MCWLGVENITVNMIRTLTLYSKGSVSVCVSMEENSCLQF